MDRDAFVQAIEESADTLYRVAWSILRNEEDVRDALQDAALRAWEKRQSLRRPEWFRTWMTRILINAAYDIRRKNKRLIPVEVLPEQPTEPPDPALSIALQRLPESLRLPLILCYSEGMTYAEAAKALHLPVATVRGRIHRGREQLRKELDIP